MQCRYFHSLLKVTPVLIANGALLLVCLVVSQPLARAQNPAPPHPAVSTPTDTTRLTRYYARLPLAFEPNLGQTDPRVKFLARTPRGTLFLTATEAVLTLPVRPAKAAAVRPSGRSARTPQTRPMPTKVAVLRMKLAGANRAGRIAGQEKLPGIINYILGNDPGKWRTSIPIYRRARFAGVYRGIDMIYYGEQNGRLEYDFRVKPGADPRQIKLAFSGAQRARVTAEGDLALTTAAGEVRWQRPVTYQVVQGRREQVACSYRLERSGEETSARFVLARYDSHRSLVIDPVLQYSTYLGGSVGEEALGIAVDSPGNAYVTGNTSSDDFPVLPGAFQTTYNSIGSFTAFVTKLNASGTGLLYSTYLGGSYTDVASGIAIDSAGHAYVTGNTSSKDFPVTPRAFQTTNNNNSYTGFVTKLNASGTALLYSTYLGGNVADQPFGIAIDCTGHAYVTGYTLSEDFPITPGAFQTTNNTAEYGFTGFVTKLNASGTALLYSTYLGGNVYDVSYGIAIDSADHAYVTGNTQSEDFPITPGAFQTTYKSSYGTSFVTKLNASGTGLLYSTYLGGSFFDAGSGIAVDSDGHAYVTGSTSSDDFPITPGAFQTTNPGAPAFVTKLNASGTGLLYSTYLGGSVGDAGSGIAVDCAGNAYVTGYTYSDNFPVTPGAFQTTNNAYATGFVTKLNASGTDLLYSTYLGGSSYDISSGIAIDSAGNAYVTGYTESYDFPVTPGAFQTTNYSSQTTGFVAKFAFGLTLFSLSPDNVPVGSGSFISTLNGYGFVPGATVLANGIPLRTTFVSSTKLTVAVPHDALATAARVAVGVLNPDWSLSNFLLFNIGQPQLQLTGVTNLTRNPNNSISVTVLLTNIGTGTAYAQLTGALLNGVGTMTRPLPGGPIPAGGKVSVTLTFPGTAGTSGQAALLSVTGTENGSDVNGFQHVTLP